MSMNSSHCCSAPYWLTCQWGALTGRTCSSCSTTFPAVRSHPSCIEFHTCNDKHHPPPNMGQCVGNCRRSSSRLCSAVVGRYFNPAPPEHPKKQSHLWMYPTVCIPITYLCIILWRVLVQCQHICHYICKGLRSINAQSIICLCNPFSKQRFHWRHIAFAC
jgi:hypothetical protein